MTSLEKAEHLVRNHPANKELMELGFGCEVEYYSRRGGGVRKAVILGETDNGARWIYDIYDKRPNAIAGIKIKQVLGKPAHLEHYLRVLGNPTNNQYTVNKKGNLHFYCTPSVHIDFNLTTGKPATEKDAEEFIKLIENHD